MRILSSRKILNNARRLLFWRELSRHVIGLPTVLIDSVLAALGAFKDFVFLSGRRDIPRTPGPTTGPVSLAWWWWITQRVGDFFCFGSLQEAREIALFDVLGVESREALINDWIWIWGQAMALAERSELFTLACNALLPFPSLLPVANPLIAEGDP